MDAIDAWDDPAAETMASWFGQGTERFMGSETAHAIATVGFVRLPFMQTDRSAQPMKLLNEATDTAWRQAALDGNETPPNMRHQTPFR